MMKNRDQKKKSIIKKPLAILRGYSEISSSITDISTSSSKVSLYIDDLIRLDKLKDI